MNDVNDPAAKEAEGAIIAVSCGKEGECGASAGGATRPIVWPFAASG
jgi:hypothetical protein